MRDDALLALSCGCEGRPRDHGHPLAGSSTPNSLKLGDPDQAATHHFKRIVASPEAINHLLVDLFPEVHRENVPDEIVFDIDATHAPVHGDQECRFLHGYYD